MRYYVNVDSDPNAEPTVVRVTELPSGALEVKLGDRDLDVDVIEVGRQLSIRIDGQMIDLTVEGTTPDLGVIASGHRSYVRVESERQRSANLAKKPGAGSGDK